MAKVMVVDNDNFSLWYYPETKIVHHHIKKFVYGETYHQLLDQGYEVFKSIGATKWLSDDRFNGPIRTNDVEWSRTVWFPQVAAAGWKYWAIVIPNSASGILNMRRNAKELTQMGITTEIFTDPGEALKWLESQK